jgi:RecJ-like exonuclease
MGSCIICGTSVEGRICELHEEDVVFAFRGTQPDELTSRRYYRGSVDGYAEFGIFVDIGDSVTGLLHKSELGQRLDSIDLEPGDTVFVQVQNVRDNGNVDLGWSIRQEESDFRGTLIDDPEADQALLAEEEDSAETTSEAETQPEDPEPVERDAEAEKQSDTAVSEPEPEPDAVTVDRLEESVGARVRIEGEITDTRQTSGPTVFQVRDETGTVECAAFEEAGVRAYPDVEAEDIVRIEGEVEKRRGELQVETEALVVLEGADRDAVTERMRDAIVQQARPGDVEPIAPEPAVEVATDSIRDAATAIRRAVIEDRPIVVRHAGTADGYVASSAIERATLPLIRERGQGADAEYHAFDRRPLEGAVYGMNDATRDVTTMLSNRERHDETLPLFVFVAAGGSAESLDGFELLDIYDVDRVVIDERATDPGVAEAVDVLVSAEPNDETTATVLAANVAVHVNQEVRGALAHLPAVSFWETTPEQYVELAAEAGYDEAATRTVRESVALEAFYQSFEDKRELIADLLFADEADDPLELAGHISEQFRERMNTEIRTAEANLERRDLDGETVLVLDTEAYTHRYEFPPKPLLLDELARRHREDAAALLGVAEDEAYIRTDADIGIRQVIETAGEQASKAGLDARGARDGRVEFLSGERRAARKALLDALASELSSATTA